MKQTAVDWLEEFLKQYDIALRKTMGGAQASA